HRAYRDYDFEVVGIACAPGQPEEQAVAVRAARGRYGLGYTMLLCESDLARSSGRDRFGVTAEPALVLLDRQGNAGWRGEPSNAASLQRLETEIRKQIGLRNP